MSTGDVLFIAVPTVLGVCVMVAHVLERRSRPQVIPPESDNVIDLNTNRGARL